MTLAFALPKVLLLTILRISLVARRMSLVKLGKVPIQHADTLVGNIGGASVPTEFKVLETETGARTTSGAGQTTKSSADTGEVVNIGDTVKYINLFIQVGSRNSDTIQDNVGWLEWAFLMVKESDTVVPITQTGVLTLGNICTNMYRNECIYTGFVPCGLNQPNGQSIVIKVPRFKQKIRIGDEWRLVIIWRDLKATSTVADAGRFILSFMYKSYS